MESITAEGDFFSSGVISDGSYGIEEGLIFSFPIRSYGNGDWEIVYKGLDLSAFAKEKISATEIELQEERSVIADLLK